MSPPFIFRIDEIHESPTAPVIVTNHGHWEPATTHGANIPRGGGVSGIYWSCDGHNLQSLNIPVGQFPQGASLYSAFSMYYCEGYGFWVLRGDATTGNPTTQAEVWRPLTFEHDQQTYASYLTNAGSSGTLRCQRPDQQWPRMLLPDIYHTQLSPTSQLYGGLKGDLAILLALLAFSMSRENLQQYLASMFRGQRWQVHGLPHGRSHQRGVVVYVYTVAPYHPSGRTDSTPAELSLYENGVYNHYYN